MFTPPNVSRVTCRVFCVMCHVSHVLCHMSCVIFFLFFRTKWWSLSLESLLSTGPTPYSSIIYPSFTWYLHGFSYVFVFCTCKSVRWQKMAQTDYPMVIWDLRIFMIFCFFLLQFFVSHLKKNLLVTFVERLYFAHAHLFEIFLPTKKYKWW